MRLRTLNGAPVARDLDFSPEALLNTDELQEFQPDYFGPSEYTSQTSSLLKWQRLDPRGTRLRSGLSQPYLPEGPMHGSDPDLTFEVPSVDDPSRLEVPDASNLSHSNLETLTEVSAFVEQSLLLHETLQSSQIANDDAADKTVSSTSFMSASITSSQSAQDDFVAHGANGKDFGGGKLNKLPNLRLTSLGAIPNATHIHSIHPQTITLNMICVATAVPEYRSVSLKKGGRVMQLTELMVADDTNSGFKISFWRRPDLGRPNAVIEHYAAINSIHVGDIMLLRNVALTAFRDTVYGQSLNPSIGRVSTMVDLMQQDGYVSASLLDAMPAAGRAKFSRVSHWASIHIVSGPANLRKRNADSISPGRQTKRERDAGTHDHTLPPDTLEAV